MKPGEPAAGNGEHAGVWGTGKQEEPNGAQQHVRNMFEHEERPEIHGKEISLKGRWG